MTHRGGLSLAALAIVALVGFAVGCSKSRELNPVQGKVMYQGQPLAGALVSFHPQDRSGDPAVGLTKGDGTFELTTGEFKGADAGKYKITVICQTPIDAKGEGLSFGGEPETEDRLKGAYANNSKSTITVEVKEGPNQLEPFDLK
jgi:hypothetical protein